MKVTTLACIAFTIIAIASPAVADGKRLTTEKEFRDMVVDRQLTRDSTVLSYTGDGRISGIVRDERLEGMWNWAGATMCRTAKLGTRDLGRDCLAIFVVSDLVIVVRDEGRGTAFALRFRSEGIRLDNNDEFFFASRECPRC